MGKKVRATEEKLTIVLEGLRGETSVADICRKNCISQTQYYKWRDKFLEGGRKGLDNGIKRNDGHLKNKITELENALGRATMKIEILKKNEEMLGL